MKYTLKQHLKYLSNYSRVSAYLQANLDHIPPVWDISPFYIRPMDQSDPGDLKKWVDVLNDAYGEFNETPVDMDNARNYLSSHHFMKVREVLFLMDEEKPVGAISIGTYLENEKIACVSRIAVRNLYKGKGYGKYLICYGYGKLRQQGCKFGQSYISIIRAQSILTHFKCGFLPQFNRHYVVFNNQKRFFFIRFYVSLRLRNLYKLYRNDIDLNFTKKSY